MKFFQTFLVIILFLLLYNKCLKKLILLIKNVILFCVRGGEKVMVQFIIMWFITIIISICMSIKNSALLFKDVADAGYKIELSKIKDVYDSIGPGFDRNNKLIFLIPFVNILNQVNVTIKYNNIRPFLLDELNVMNCLEEMTDLEKEKYNENKTGFTAIKISSGYYEIGSTKIDVYIGEEKCTVYYILQKDGVKIVKATGSFNDLSLAEQKEKLSQSIYNECYKMLDDFSSELEKLEQDEKVINDKNKIEMLKEIRKQFEEIKEKKYEYVDNKEEKEEVKKLTKKK